MSDPDAAPPEGSAAAPRGRISRRRALELGGVAAAATVLAVVAPDRSGDPPTVPRRSAPAEDGTEPTEPTDPDGLDPDDPARHFDDPDGIRALGRAAAAGAGLYLEPGQVYADGGDPAGDLDPPGAVDGGDRPAPGSVADLPAPAEDTYADALGELIAADERAGRIVDVGGWRLTRTEAEVCAAAARFPV